MPFFDALGLYVRAQANYQREKAWELWKAVYPDMVKGAIRFVPFSHFWERMQASNKRVRAEDAIAKAQQIVAADKQRRSDS